MREQKTSVNDIELVVPQARASILLLKFNVRGFRRFGIFSCQRENLRVRVGADNVSLRSNYESHQDRHVSAATTYIQAFHPCAQTDSVEQPGGRRQQHTSEHIETVFAFVASANRVAVRRIRSSH